MGEGEEQTNKQTKKHKKTHKKKIDLAKPESK